MEFIFPVFPYIHSFYMILDHPGTHLNILSARSMMIAVY
uniref:Uncharacterized protein n=1 Tax=Utricularia reniformis TaxID=192314 RepID=A0A1Y0B0J3_9LAMI|nr:hypothetical protein AEK19_MT0728 [Utricularia reniformis]ART30972.1 hypothetical protein AEK19_MT0728 [Utricularia reniformis]